MFTHSPTATMTVRSGGTRRFWVFVTVVALLAGTMAITAAPAGAIVVAPGAPQSVSGVTGNGTMMLGWLPPANDGGDPNLTYTVTGTPGGSCTTTATSCQISGLSNGVDYSFTVTATNGAGSGPASDPLNARIGASPPIISCDGSTPSPLTDISGSFARADIDCLYELEVTGGITATLYGPGGDVTREQMAAFLARLWRVLGGNCSTTPAPLTDIAGSFAKADIGCIFNLGVTGGITATLYGPGGDVTREQMAAFLARLWRVLGGNCSTKPAPLTDIGSSFARTDIDCIYNLGVTGGITPTLYGPSLKVTREQMAAFLARLYRAATTTLPLPPAPPPPLPSPGDTADCGDFATQAQAQAWFDYYFASFGDVAKLDPNGNSLACEGSDVTPPPPPPPPNPGDSKNCSDFATQAAAQAWFDTYFPFYGDVAKLDADNNGVPCESLP